jgi:hypothetical protein
MASFVMLLQEEGGSGAGILGGIMGLGFLVVWCAIVLVILASMWITFTKAGEPGWACLIPIYNLVVLCRMAGKPWWWILLMLIPFVNIVVMIIVFIALAKNFGKGAGFGIGLAFLGFIFFPMLAWGDAKFQPQT